MAGERNLDAKGDREESQEKTGFFLNLQEWINTDPMQEDVFIFVQLFKTKVLFFHF